MTKMALKLDMVGKTFGPFVHEYTFKDMILFALGCGAGADGITDLEYVYEKDLKILPIYGAMLAEAYDVSKAMDFGFNWDGSLHWGFDIRFHQPLTKASGTLSTTCILKQIYDRGPGKGALALNEATTYDETGAKLFTNESTDIELLDGGFGGQKQPVAIVEIPDRAPDYEVAEQVPLNQALIYRLSGDYFKVHADWEYAKECGYEKPILHGLSTSGAACRHIIKSLFPGEPERITRFKVRITAPLYPGSTVKTQIWKMGDHLVHFRVINAETGVNHLNYGLAEWK
jgi:acyl dehydratase